MKLAKAKKEDIDALGCLAGAVDTMRDGGVPPKEEGEDWDYYLLITGDQSWLKIFSTHLKK